MDPLRENTAVRQRPEEGFRRWFVNRYFDLILWYDAPGGQLQGFQLCYSRNNHEKAFTWTGEFASSRHVSDTYYEEGQRSMSTGILKGDAGEIPETVLERLREEAGPLTQDQVQFIADKVHAYNHQRRAEVS